MRLVLQRVKRASVTVDEEVVGEIGKGMLVLVGIHGMTSSRTLLGAAQCTNQMSRLARHRRDAVVLDATPADSLVDRRTV